MADPTALEAGTGSTREAMVCLREAAAAIGALRAVSEDILADRAVSPRLGSLGVRLRRVLALTR